MTQAPATPRAARRRHDREIVALAVPAFGALVAEPLFVMVDSAIVGHLGTPQLAGLGVAAALLTTAVSIFVFLAYATTAAVARRVGAGDLPAAIRQGMDGIWLALLLGAAVIAVVLPTAPWLVGPLRRLRDRGPLRHHLSADLRARHPGHARRARRDRGAARSPGHPDPALRRHRRASPPTPRSTRGLVYGAGLGIAGSAWGTVIAQCGMAAVYLVVVVRGARRHGASLRPDAAGIRACAQAGVPLLVRTLSLRAILMIATAVAARLGDADIAAHQIILSLWSLLAFALDAIAIAGQAIIGRYLGAGRRRGRPGGLPPDGAVGDRRGCRARAAGGARPAAVHAAVHQGPGGARTPLLPALLVVALSQPICGVVFVLDGC